MFHLSISVKIFVVTSRLVQNHINVIRQLSRLTIEISYEIVWLALLYPTFNSFRIALENHPNIFFMVASFYLHSCNSKFFDFFSLEFFVRIIF